MSKNFLNGLTIGAGILCALVAGIAIALAADILTVDKDGTIRLRVSDKGKVTLNTSDAAEGDLRFTSRSSDPTAPLAGDLWYNSTDKEVKYADGGLTKPLAEMTNAAITLYVNGTTGNDNNAGLTSGTAVRTIQKAVNLVPPVVRHAVTINVAAGTYLDLGATVGGSITANVYVGEKVVTASGSITFVGDEATPANVRVTGSASAIDTTPTRYQGFYIYGVRNVTIKGFLCNYYLNNGIYYCYYALGSPQNCVSSNNGTAGIYYDWYSFGSPTSCTTNSNTSYGILYNGHCSGIPSSCTINSNGSVGMLITAGSYVSPSSCSVSSNGSHGIRYHMNSCGFPGNNTSTSNNTGYGIYGSAGGIADYNGTTPGGTTAATGADANSAVY